jgi:hypothetical protein
MKKIILLLALALTACSKSDSKSDDPALTPAPAVPASTCATPIEMTSGHEPATQVSLAKLKEERVGRFKVVRAVFHAKKVNAEGATLSEMTGSVDLSPQMPLPSRECIYRYQQEEPEINQVIPRYVFLPSERLTIFDENEPQDNPNYNLPLLASFKMNRGLVEFKGQNESTIGQAPYLKNRYLGELLNMPSEQKAYFLSNNPDEFEMMISIPQGNLQDSTQSVWMKFTRE